MEEVGGKFSCVEKAFSIEVLMSVMLGENRMFTPKKLGLEIQNPIPQKRILRNKEDKRGKKRNRVCRS